MIHKGAIILGVLVGAGIGVLLAPDKGKTTRDRLKKEGKEVKDQITKDFKEVKDDLSKATASGKKKLKEEINNLASKTSYQTEKAITFLEKQLAILKEKNNSFQQAN
ncbi:YtxH domain-containing protein [Winogradskyella sp. A2]|uniref:YtxH domain-containing protein n=1 Tax=Winogradskyella sp. A2 TaxID=3366944 RepID=UPI00398C6EA7